MTDDLGGKIMIHFVGLRAKIYSYLIDNGSEDKKAKGIKKCVKENLNLRIRRTRRISKLFRSNST